MSSNGQEERFVRFRCNSEFQFCELCHEHIPYQDWVKATPSTEVPLEGWANKRCYPDCKQAAKDRKTSTPALVPPGGVPHETKTFRAIYDYNKCVKCDNFIEVGTMVTATRVDVPDGYMLRRWHNFVHYYEDDCSPPDVASTLRCDAAPISPVKEEEEEEKAARKEEDVGARMVRPEDVEEGHGDDTVVTTEDLEHLLKRRGDAQPSPPRKRGRSSSPASSARDVTSRNLAETEGWVNPTPAPGCAPVKQDLTAVEHGVNENSG
eukprot:g2592.t2